MKSPAWLSDSALLGHIRRLPHSRASFKQLVRELGARGTAREELETALARLAAQGRLIELRPGRCGAAPDAQGRLRLPYP
jgi:hypothetical protein